jgi:hypothetical protein
MKIEGKLELFGKLLLIAGLLGALVLFVASGFVPMRSSSDSWGANGLSPLYLILAVTAALQGFTAYLLFAAGAEIITLLRGIASDVRATPAPVQVDVEREPKR